MKAKFTIKRTFASVIELELDDAFVIFNSADNLENIMRHARKQYSSLVAAGKEPEIADQIDFDIVPVCDECGIEIYRERLPYFVDGRMVCESCYDSIFDHNQRECDLKKVGVDLEKIAEMIREKMLMYNQCVDNIHARKALKIKLETIVQILDAMNITLQWRGRDGLFTLFALNNKTYTV